MGIDLAGPSNARDTVAAIFVEAGVGLELDRVEQNLDDERIADLFMSFEKSDQIVVGLDAPLSYQPGGGDRPADRALRRRLTERGLASGTVMTPTMSRMAYLTLRGVAVARLVLAVSPRCRIVEVHPAGALVTRGADAHVVREMKRSDEHRSRLVDWLGGQGLEGLAADIPTDHVVAAHAAALAAWDWSRNRARWLHPAVPPLHPFDFAC